MTILVTGAAGFIGYHLCRYLVARGEQVVGVDDLNPYYDPRLKRARLSLLNECAAFTFIEGDISQLDLPKALHGTRISKVVHLAAQAGVRYSLDNPRAYVKSNLVGHLEILELCRNLGDLDHLVYASSSSVYGGNEKVPFSEDDNVDHPVSLYAATKKSDELMSYAYAHLYGIRQTGLRFFTVYGPWGRPDMAYWLFTEAILQGKPVRVFNNGEMWRDFTYIDDIVQGIVAVLDHPPQGTPPHQIYNLGNNRPENLMHFLDVLEDIVGVKAVRRFEPMQPGDVIRTYADISRIQRDVGFNPSTDIRAGLTRFVDWYKQYHI
ncbi:NAD-dependent epimerase/dehydratase family protein [Parvibaculum sp.]|uniref:NAD-dependent epimerase/dehydratase family protein n=1 Tax=Parvibaculum sp. TaxID=2024848 RepID=UPI003299F50B